MTNVQMPKPWHERQDSEAALLAPPAVTHESVRPAPGMARVGNALANKVTSLGRRTATCELHGEYESTGVRFNATRPHDSWTGCPTCREIKVEGDRQARIAVELASRRASLEERLARTCLPDRFIGRTFETYVAETPEQRQAAMTMANFALDFDQHLERGTTLILSGSVGTGKSHLAGAVMQQISAEHLSLYVTLMGMVRMVRDTWRSGSERSETAVLADLARVDLLVIDEVGVQYGTDAEKLMLFEVLDRRYMDKKPSILLTNLPMVEFKDFCGDRVYDRLREVGKFVKFDWPSYRAKAREV